MKSLLAVGSIYVITSVFYFIAFLRLIAGIAPALKKLLVTKIIKLWNVHTDYSFIELNVQILAALVPCSRLS